MEPSSPKIKKKNFILYYPKLKLFPSKKMFFPKKTCSEKLSYILVNKTFQPQA